MIDKDYVYSESVYHTVLVALSNEMAKDFKEYGVSTSSRFIVVTVSSKENRMGLASKLLSGR
jgi:hypothetical protein